MNKEHFWPQWLIRRTNTHKTRVRFNPEKLVNPKKLTIPLCIKCNTDFGRELEEPTSRIFGDLEEGRGLSDVEAETLVRWLWKFEGLSWSIQYPHGLYSEKYTLRDRVLLPLDDIRDHLTLAVALIAKIEPEFGDAPMGIDSHTYKNAVFVGGVFSRLALMVLDRRFDAEVPESFGLYHFSDPAAPDRDAKLYFPPVGFNTCVEAVSTTYTTSQFLSYLHDTRT
jgi:hypothetical protein